MAGWEQRDQQALEKLSSFPYGLRNYLQVFRLPHFIIIRLSSRIHCIQPAAGVFRDIFL